ncbi:hypothetical protein HPB50_002277 [Hyalomma asiaticum]|uniref:Uncharacterized protein n=1 Tax=Hyalomma asiaticum TaxID=266040 RepID=A0ACB7TB21_HYAAI|nr:hypothetical protein HPB50_002277 [Hyalomma asiaticum]
MSLRRPFSEEDTGPLLTLGDRVVWLFEHGPEHGWVRWIGRIPVVSPNWTIGVEFPGSGKDVEAAHLTAAHLLSSCSTRERGVCGTSKLHQSQSTHAQDEPNLSDYDNWLGGKDPCNVHVKSWKSSSTHSVVSCPPVLLPKMLVTREQTSSSDSDVNFGSLRSLMSCFTLGSHRKKKRRKKKKKSHRLVIVTGSDNSNHCCPSGSVSAAQGQVQHVCEGDIRHSAKKYSAKELPRVSSGPKAIWRYSLQEQDMQKNDASCKEPAAAEVAEQKTPPKLPPKTCTRKKRLAPQPPGDNVTPTGTLLRKQPMPPVDVLCSSSSVSTDSLSLTRRRSRKKPAPLPPRDCLSNSVRYAEEAMVKCPFRNDEYSCSSHLQEREIRALVSPEVYEHHLSRSVKTAESQAPNSFHCKTADCPGWCMLEDNVNTFMCPVCGHSNCLTCRAIHEGKNCLQYQDELDFNAPDGQEAKQTKEYLDGKGDTSAGCKCGVNGVKCHPKCNYCH